MWQETLRDLRRVCVTRPPSLLVLGALTPEHQNDALRELRAAYGLDACRPQSILPFELPSTSTVLVIIDDLTALSTDDQLMLMRWLDRHQDAAVLSFAAHPVFPLVRNGTFLEGLFYRLNIVTLTVQGAAV